MPYCYWCWTTLTADPPCVCVGCGRTLNRVLMPNEVPTDEECEQAGWPLAWRCVTAGPLTFALAG